MASDIFGNYADSLCEERITDAVTSIRVGVTLRMRILRLTTDVIG